MNDLIGGRYRIERRLGKGGMGAVYEATDTQNGARVAVKVVTAEVAKNELLLGRFEREVRAARGLDTPHVVRAIDAGRDPYNGLPFLVMEVLEGEDVRVLLKRLGPIRPDLALRIVAQTCRGLEVAHAQRIVHRDVKPANLFLSKGAAPGERLIKILDFGIAKLAPDPEDTAETGDVTSLTRTGSMLGSPLYMAPEQARGHKNMDGRVDLWSLGVVLYQALTGVTPHRDSGALGDLIIAICTEPAERVERLAPWVPPEVAAVVHRALNLDPASRFQSASEMLASVVPLLPQGEANAAIHDRMLVPLPESERARHAAPPRAPSGVAMLSEPPRPPAGALYGQAEHHPHTWSRSGASSGQAEVHPHARSHAGTPHPGAYYPPGAEVPAPPWSNSGLMFGAETPAAMQLGGPTFGSTVAPQSAPPKRRSAALPILAMAAIGLAVGGTFALVGVRSASQGSGQTSAEQTNPGQTTTGRMLSNAPIVPAAPTAPTAPPVETSAALAPSAAPGVASGSASGRNAAPWPKATSRASTAPKPTAKSDIYLGR